MGIRIYISTIVAGILSCATLIGQNNQEVSVYGGGGLSTLKYKTVAGKQDNGTGGLFGIDYTYFFSEKLGFSSGLEIALYNAKMQINDFSDRYMVKDIDEDEFEFRTVVTNYEEKQNTAYLNIPLMLRFQTGGNNKFYAAAGGKIGLPLGGNYKINSSTIKNSGYYADEDYEYTTQEFMGFGTFTDRNISDEVKFKMALILSAELGVRWQLKEGLYLYTGTYIDYGLNDILNEEKNKRFVEYNAASPRDFILNGALVSQYSNDNKTAAFIDKITPMAVGIKIRLAFDTNRLSKM
ncbi:MAG: outer membrane beta-barrel protein [Dysgonomonas sp.]